MYLGAGWRSGKLACTAQQGTWEVKQFIHNFLHGTSYSLFQTIARKMKLMRSEGWYLWICSWMLEIHHKQAEVVVSRVLSEKLLLKNKTLANEYKKLKVWKLAITLLQFDIVLQTCECCSLCLCHSSKIKLLIRVRINLEQQKFIDCLCLCSSCLPAYIVGGPCEKEKTVAFTGGGAEAAHWATKLHRKWGWKFWWDQAVSSASGMCKQRACTKPGINCEIRNMYANFWSFSTLSYLSTKTHACAHS